jgi:hypothetical protein
MEKQSLTSSPRRVRQQGKKHHLLQQDQWPSPHISSCEGRSSLWTRQCLATGSQFLGTKTRKNNKKHIYTTWWLVPGIASGLLNYSHEMPWANCTLPLPYFWLGWTNPLGIPGRERVKNPFQNWPGRSGGIFYMSSDWIRLNIRPLRCYFNCNLIERKEPISCLLE